jgi:hypothetical protein
MESESLNIQYASIPMLDTKVRKSRMRTRSSGKFNVAGQIPATLLSRCSSKYEGNLLVTSPLGYIVSQIEDSFSLKKYQSR